MSNLENYGLNENGISDNGSPYWFVPVQTGECADGSSGYATLEECAINLKKGQEIVVMSEDSDYCEKIISFEDAKEVITEIIVSVLKHYDDLTDEQKQLLRPIV